MIAKENYRQFCLDNIDLPIFSQAWWLDAVCGINNWDVALVEKGGEIMASLPFYKQRIKKDLFLSRPPLTQCLGPFIRYPSGQSYYKKLSWEKELMDALIEQLPEYGFFDQHFHHSIKNWLPFYLKGYSQTTRYTYVIENTPFDYYLENIVSSSRKRRIKKAEKLGVRVFESDDVEIFYDLNKKTFIRQGVKIPYSNQLIIKLFDACANHKAVKILLAEYEGNVVAGGFYVIDGSSVYYLMGGIDPQVGDVGAMDLVQIAGIKYAMNNNLRFDFEGSMMESIEKYFRSFGSTQQSYFHVTKTDSRKLKLKRFLKDIIK